MTISLVRGILHWTSCAAHSPSSCVYVWTSFGGQESTASALSFTGDGDLPSAYAVTDFASAAIAVAALSIAELVGLASSRIATVAVDRRLSSFYNARS